MKTGIMLIGVAIMGSLFYSGCSGVQAAPQKLAAVTQEIVGEVKEKDSSVFEEIQQNIDMVASLKTSVETCMESEKQDLLKDVVKELEKIADSYTKLAGKREDIRKELLKKVTDLEELQVKVREEIARLNQLRRNYSSALSAINDPDPEIVRTRKAALTQAVRYIDMQIQLWNEFHATEGQIKEEIVIVQQRINGFLSVIESSAILFREGLNLLKLQCDINDALSLFTQDLPQIEELTKDMENSWSHLDTLVHTLTSMSINLNKNQE